MDVWPLKRDHFVAWQKHSQPAQTLVNPDRRGQSIGVFVGVTL